MPPGNHPAHANAPRPVVSGKIYAREVKGVFTTGRWILVWLTQVAFFGLCWLDWNGRQAVLFHLVERKFYLFGFVLWPQDTLYLAVLLIILAYALFLVTAIIGRVFCGYACPQSVYTLIFMWIENRIEGARPARIKRDGEPKTAHAFWLKTAKHLSWAGLSLWMGVTFVGYFTPIRNLMDAFPDLAFGPWEWFWMLFYAGFTYFMAGYMREKMCKYVCPYARFQGSMFDADTLIITYDKARGEPRGARKKGLSNELGDCVDCALCVQVCPTGIDIRQGLQNECIACAACIDACNPVMDRVGLPRGLIRYFTEHGLANNLRRRDVLGRIVRPRVVVYAVILISMIAAMSWSMSTLVPLKVEITRDRYTLAREVEGGVIENVYDLQVTNTAELRQRFRMTVSGLDSATIATGQQFEVAELSRYSASVRITARSNDGKKGANPIFLKIMSQDDPNVFVQEKTTFFQP